MNRKQTAYIALQYTKNHVYTQTLMDIIEVCKQTDHPSVYKIGNIIENTLQKIKRINDAYEEEFGDYDE